jgi:hypothetical protein
VPLVNYVNFNHQLDKQYTGFGDTKVVLSDLYLNNFLHYHGSALVILFSKQKNCCFLVSWKRDMSVYWVKHWCSFEVCIIKSATWPSSASPTIKLRWYGRGEGTSYTIVQHSPSCVRAAAVDAACSRSGVAVPSGPADASEGGIRAAENCVAGGNWTQDLGSGTILEDPPLPVQP